MILFLTGFGTGSLLTIILYILLKITLKKENNKVTGI